MTLNLHRVDDRLWRSGQPLADDWPELYTAGIRGVLKLNAPAVGAPPFDDLVFDSTLTATSFRLFPIEMWGIHITHDEAQTALRDPALLDRIDDRLDILRGSLPGAVLVHCTEGKDLTGIVIARWRVRCCGWSKKDAWDEWVAYGSHGYTGLVDAWNAWYPKP